jgi:hypothetical protein
MARKKSDGLSPTMIAAVSLARENGGKLTRYEGGFWCRSGLKDYENPWFGTTTIQALVSRGVLVYSRWFNGSRARFAIEVTLTANVEDQPQ